jgi:hypothetical protein
MREAQASSQFHRILSILTKNKKDVIFKKANFNNLLNKTRLTSNVDHKRC